MRWEYGVALKREDDGNFYVSVRDIPEAITYGATEQEALAMALDAIEVFFRFLMDNGKPLPNPTPIEPGEHAVALPAQFAAKASVYNAWRASGLTKVQLAERMGRRESEVRRILSPHYGTKLNQLEEAARALGGRLDVAFAQAA